MELLARQQGGGGAAASNAAAAQPTGTREAKTWQQAQDEKNALDAISAEDIS